jgi:hypothetical protein
MKTVVLFVALLGLSLSLVMRGSHATIKPKHKQQQLVGGYSPIKDVKNLDESVK